MAVPNLTANSPVNGSIAWSAFTIQYGGVGYSVPASSSAMKYVYWLYNGGSPSLQASNTLPTLGDDDLLLFVNKSGVPINVPASNVVDGSLIVDGTIVGSAVIAGTLHGDRIQGDTITANQVASNAIGVNELAANAVVAAKIAAKQIDVSKMVITSFDNLVGDPNFLLPLGSGWTSLSSVLVSGGEGGRTNAGVLNPNAVTQYPVAQPAWAIETEKGAAYRARVKIWSDIDLPANVVSIRVRFTATDGSTADVTAGSANTALLAGAWQELGGLVTVPSDKTYVTVGYFLSVNAHPTQTIRFAEPSFVRAASANLIVDGSVDATKVRANSIDVSKLTIASFENFIYDPTFQLDLNSAGGWSTSGGGMSISVTGSRSGGRAVQIANTAVGQNLINSAKNIPAEAGDVFNLSAYVRQTTATLAGGVFMTVEWKLTNGTTSWTEVVAPALVANTWTRFSGKVTAPANTVSINQIIIASRSTNTTGSLLIDYVQGVRAASGELIVDGAVVTAKLDANAVTTDKLQADAITAKHTITGATFQTTATAARGIKIAGSVLTAYDGSGNAALVANGNDGSLTLAGPNTQIVGAKFMSALTGERVEVGTYSSALSAIQFFSGDAKEVTPARIVSDAFANGNDVGGYMQLTGPAFTTDAPGGYSPVITVGRNSTPSLGSLAAMQADDTSLFGNKVITISTNTNDPLTNIALVSPQVLINGAEASFVGEIRMYASANTPPTGWLHCRGQEVSRTTYAALFAVIGTTYGAGNGSTTFNVPDFRARSPIGIGGATVPAAGSNNYSLGQKWGHEAVGSHQHQIARTLRYTGTSATGHALAYEFSPDGGDGTAYTYANDGAGSMGNVHPVLGMNFIVRAA